MPAINLWSVEVIIEISLKKRSKLISKNSQYLGLQCLLHTIPISSKCWLKMCPKSMELSQAEQKLFILATPSPPSLWFVL